MFDLETAIATWRRSLEYNRAFLTPDLNELERHVRDQVEALVEQGEREKDAFRRALREMGGYGVVEAEYRKVYWGKRRRRGELIRELIWRSNMLKNYLKIAFRNLRRHMGYALINLIGLAVGLTCFLLVFLYLQHEYSFDTYHEKGDRLYRLVEYAEVGDVKVWDNSVSGDPIPRMRNDYPDVEDASELTGCGADRIENEGEIFREIRMKCSESNLFNLFSFDLVEGDPNVVLDRPNTAVVTRSLSELLFGDQNPVGQSIPVQFYGEDRLFEITGLMEDVPKNTHFSFDLLLSYESLRTTNICLHCGEAMYALLRPGADPEVIASRVQDLIRSQGKEYVKDLRLEPIREIHFSEVMAERQGDKRYAYLLSVIGLVLLLIACANYMNLATARSITRTREVGVRKVVGAHRAQLVGQFLTETLVLTGLALPLAIGLLLLSLPFFNTVADTDISLSLLNNLGFLGAVAGLIVVVGFLAGSYPALFLSQFRPVEVLRGRSVAGFSGVRLRRGLVVLQFAISIILLIGTAVVVKQLSFMQTQKLGFDAEQVVLIRIFEPELTADAEVIKEAVLRQSGVLNSTAGWGMPGQNGFHGSNFVSYPFGKDGPSVRLATPHIDADFLKTMRIPLLAGRNIAEGPADPTEGRGEALVNEATVRAMKWDSPEEVLGKEVYRMVVVGVVPDFNFKSLHQTIEPLLMRQRETRAGLIAVRLAAGNVPETLEALEETWESLGSTMPFEYRFLREELNQLYENEQRTATVFSVFAGLVVLIACLGLFGLAAFATARRTKEIGIRKVFGATVVHLVGLLTVDFVKLVAIAFVVAAPVAYFVATRWLEDFAYRIELGPNLFILAGGLALAIALITTGIQAVRSALANPIDSLRYE